MKVRHFFLVCFILFITGLQPTGIKPALGVAAEKSISPQYSQISEGSNTELALKESDSNSSKHCKIVEIPGIPIPVSHQLKNKYSARFKHQFIIYSKRANSLLGINNNVICAKINISPLSGILQI